MKILLASQNPGKLNEFQALFRDTHYHIVSSSDLGEVEETGLSFVENAIIKARHAAAVTGLPTVADDSGIEVDVLDGAPGIYSARYAGENCDATENVVKLLQALKGVPHVKRTARFQCALVFMRHAKDPMPLVCQGTWPGIIADAPIGAKGFGYDPIFYVPEKECTAAELSRDEKNKISHRARAMKLLLEKMMELN